MTLTKRKREKFLDMVERIEEMAAAIEQAANHLTDALERYDDNMELSRDDRQDPELLAKDVFDALDDAVAAFEEVEQLRESVTKAAER